jgi:hypothetical protein
MYVTSMQRGALEFVADIAPFFGDLDSEEMRNHNRSVFSKLSTDPSPEFHSLFSSIPHDAKSGSVEWSVIGEGWRPKRFSHDAEALREEVRRLRKQPFRAALKLWKYQILRGLSKFSPPLPSRMARRFGRSAEKRNPDIVN